MKGRILIMMYWGGFTVCLLCIVLKQIHVLFSLSVPGAAHHGAMVSWPNEGGQADGWATNLWLLCRDWWKRWHILGPRERHLCDRLHPLVLVQHPISWWPKKIQAFVYIHYSPRWSCFLQRMWQIKVWLHLSLLFKSDSLHCHIFIIFSP